MDIETKLINACEAGDLETVKKYLNPRKVLWLELKKADVNAFVRGKGTPLKIAILEGNKELVELLTAHGADVCQADKSDMETPLHVACKFKKSTIAKLLVTSGANFNAKDKEGKTPLHLSVKEYDMETVAFLLRRGADVNAKTYDMELEQHLSFDGRKGKSPSDWTHDENYKIMEDHGITPLHIAAMGLNFTDDDQQLQMIKLLVENGADPNAKNRNGNTPLHVLRRPSRGFYLQILEFLKTHGAGLDVRNNYGETPLSILSKNELYNQYFDYYKAIFDFFFQNGANINCGKGRSPYKEAERFGRQNIVQYFNSILDY